MSVLGSFIYKETLHLVRDKRTMLIAILLPMVLVVLFGFAISTEVNHIRFVVAASLWNDDVRQLTEKLSASELLDYKGAASVDEAELLLRRGKIEAAIVFNSDGGAQVIADASNPNNAQTVSAYVGGILSSGPSDELLPVTHMLYNPQMKSSYNFVPGILGLILILICAILTSISIVREKEHGTMELLLVSPVKPIYIIIGKIVPYFFLACIDLAGVLLLSKFVLGVPMNGSMAGIIVVSLVYVALSLALGLLISTLASSQIVALIISAALMLIPLMMFSGMLFDTSSMPKVLQWISAAVPARWYIDAMKRLMVQGVSFPYVMKDLTILCGMMVAFLAVSLKKFNDKLE